MPRILDVYALLDGAVTSHYEVTSHPEIFDGVRLHDRQTIAVVRHNARVVLSCERVILNFLQRLSGIATLTRQFVDAVSGTRARILDTRKTAPGLRILDKYAVRCGGGQNHRLDLSDGVLIKHNHIALAGSIAACAGTGAPQPPRVAAYRGGSPDPGGIGRCARSWRGSCSAGQHAGGTGEGSSRALCQGRAAYSGGVCRRHWPGERSGLCRNRGGFYFRGSVDPFSCGRGYEPARYAGLGWRTGVLARRVEAPDGRDARLPSAHLFFLPLSRIILCITEEATAIPKTSRASRPRPQDPAPHRTDLRLGRIVRLLMDHATVVVSGTKIADEIGTGRSEVWRLVQQLRALGVEIAGHPATGYQLKAVPDLLLPDMLAPALKGTIFGADVHRNYHHYYKVGSTNVEAMESAASGAPEGSVFVAEEQTAGRDAARIIGNQRLRRESTAR